MARANKAPAGGANKPAARGPKANGAAARKPAARKPADPGRELAGLREAAAALGADLRAARSEAAVLRKQLAELREEQTAAARDFETRLGRAAEKLDAAKKVIEQLPRQTEESRWRAEEMV